MVTLARCLPSSWMLSLSRRLYLRQGPKLRATVIRKAAMTASDIVTANPFAKPFMPALGKMMKPVASMASPAATAKKWKRVEGIFPPS
jgi:hypothetical protein